MTHYPKIPKRDYGRNKLECTRSLKLAARCLCLPLTGSQMPGRKRPRVKAFPGWPSSLHTLGGYHALIPYSLAKAPPLYSTVLVALVLSGTGAVSAPNARARVGMFIAAVGICFCCAVTRNAPRRTLQRDRLSIA